VVTSTDEIKIGLTNPISQLEEKMGLNSNPVVLTQEETLRNGVTEKLSKNQLNSGNFFLNK